MRTRPKRQTKRAGKASPPLDAERLRVDLSIHQDELAAQNEELRQTNAALAAANARYAALYEWAPIPFLTIDAERAILEVNRAAEALIGSERPALLGTAFDVLVAASARGSFRRFHERVSGEGPSVHETVLSSGDRRAFVRIEASRLGGADATGDECILCVVDETDQRRAAEERLAMEGRLAETHRLESLGMLAGGIAHDFNNILTVALTCSDLIAFDPSASSQTREAASSIREAVVRAANLADQMLAYSGRRRIQTKPIDLSQLARSMRDLLHAATPKGSLVLDLEDGLPLVAGDSARLQQMLLNLVVNAAESVGAHGSGKILVRTARVSDVRDDGGGQVLLQVTDDGVGMDESTVRKIFDPFFSTKFTGRGLGLAVVHGGVRTHGGTITVDSLPGRGATFRICLPALEDAARPAPEGAHDEAAWRASGRVLVVDDSTEIRAAMGRLLGRLGFEVSFAEHGLAALDVASAPPSPLVAVVLDLTMPELDGRATLTRLKASYPTLPVVLASGFASEDLDEELLRAADGFIPKPFSFATLRRILKAALTKT